MILQNLLDNLLVNIKEDKTSIAYRKAKTLVVILVSTMLLLTVLY